METAPLDQGARKKYAKVLAQGLLKNAGVLAAPVSLQRVVEHLQTTRSLDVQKYSFGEKVSGLLVLQTSSDAEHATIGFNENHPWYRRRFTICHEIGHLLMSHICKSGLDDHSETEANIFASELLIPTHLIKADFKKTPDLQALAKLYRVSTTALSIKLMDTRLIK